MRNGQAGPDVPTDRPVRVVLFSDTVADVNGPARFVQNVAEQARRRGLALTVLTSTRLRCPRESNIVNCDPIASLPMPRYPELRLVLPPVRSMLRLAARQAPDVIHVSTPGPVGLVGLLAAWRLRVPVLGVYHTDFPAYIDRLFNDDGLSALARGSMRAFYARFAGVFARSDDYAASLAAVGVPAERVLPLRPGIDTGLFSADQRDPSVWAGVPGVRPDAVKVLYVGRVSVEKNLPLLVEVWRGVRAAVGDRAQLIVVGGGPYLDRMRAALDGQGAVFAGYRFGSELARLYASSDFFVFPSVTDTLGQVVMESQSCGLPALVSDVGGPKEMVVDGATGLVLHGTDPRPWVREIVGLIADRPRRRAMGEAASRHMRAYSIERSFEHWWSAHACARRTGGRSAIPARNERDLRE